MLRKKRGEKFYTYNYGRYYREAYDQGIRAIYGKTGLDSIPMLERIIEIIKEKYIKNGEWITLAKMRPDCIWDGD